MSEPILRLCDVAKRFGATVTAAGVSLSLEEGEFFTLLGPSGSGKSTVLRMIAGLERPDAGRILLSGEDVTDFAPWRRGLGMVFQNYAVFPHLTVSGNVAYGLRRLRMKRGERDERVSEMLDLVGLGGFADRQPQQLSGGEQQRVAIARALAPRPAVILLDEPLSALDEKIRREMQIELRRIQTTTRTTFVYVTHDQEEALTMSDRIAVLNAGHVVQCDAPERIFRRPATTFVAGFFRGCNVLETTEGPGGGRLAGVPLPVDLDCAPGAPVAIRSENVRLKRSDDRAAIVLEAKLEAAIYRGLYTDYQLRLEDGQTLSAIAQDDVGVKAGDAVSISIAAADITPLARD